MKEIFFEINSSEEIWTLIDKNFNHIFIHRFTPHEAIEWWKTNITMKDNEVYQNLEVRNMQFDISTDLNGLQRIINLHTNHLRIYQFDRPIPNTLSFEHLPSYNRDKILKQNGLKHTYFCDFEFITVSSSDENFINTIKENQVFKERIEERKSRLGDL